MQEIQLKRDLRRELLRGTPWVYSESLQSDAGASLSDPAEPQVVRVKDKKNQALGVGIWCPGEPLRLRMLSTELSQFHSQHLHERLSWALKARSHLAQQDTNAFRWVNGEGDLLPGLIVDVYQEVAVVQYDGPSCRSFWSHFADLGQTLPQIAREEGLQLRAILAKPRDRKEPLIPLFGPLVPTVAIKENAAIFEVDLKQGQKTGFFLDQRPNRVYVRHLSKSRRVLNLFSYTGGFSINAGLGGAREVCSVDISAGASQNAVRNWQLNGLTPTKHQTRTEDAFEFLKDNSATWDLTIVDPPSMASSEKAKKLAQAKYEELFYLAAKRCTSGGDLLLSSCSSHIDFPLFSTIITQAIGRARRKGQVLRISGQGEDHPFPLAAPELRYLKFFHLRIH